MTEQEVAEGTMVQESIVNKYPTTIVMESKRGGPNDTRPRTFELETSINVRGTIYELISVCYYDTRKNHYMGDARREDAEGNVKWFHIDDMVPTPGQPGTQVEGEMNMDRIRTVEEGGVRSMIMLVYLKQQTKSSMEAAADLAALADVNGPIEEDYEDGEADESDRGAPAGGAAEVENFVAEKDLAAAGIARSGVATMTQRFHEEGDDEIIYDDSSDEETNDETIDAGEAEEESGNGPDDDGHAEENLAFMVDTPKKSEDQEAKEHGDGPIRSLWTQLVLNGAPPQNTNAYFTMVGSDIEAMITSGVDDATILKTLTLLPFLANRARMAMDSMQPLHGRPSAASVEVGMVSVEATEPLEAVGVGDSDNALLEAVDAHETVDEIVAAHDDEIEKSFAVRIGGMEAIVVQDNDIEASHGADMEDISMDDGAAIVEGIETCQGELVIEDGSVGNGTIDVDGAQGDQGVQLVGRHLTSMDSGGIVGAKAQLGAADDVGARPFGAESEAAPSNGIPRPSNWRERSRRAQRRWTQQNIWNEKYEGSE